MDVTVLIALIIVAGMTGIGSMIVLRNNLYRRLLKDCEKRFGMIDGMRSTLNTSLVRLMRLEDKVNQATKTQATEKKENSEAAEQSVTKQSVIEVLQHLGFSPEVTSQDYPDSVDFRISNTSYRIETSNLPFLSLEMGFVINPTEEDIESMTRAAAEVTAGIFIGKVNVSSNGRTVVCTAEWICNSFIQLQNTISMYINIVNESHKRLIDTYSKMKDEKIKKEFELATKAFPMNDGMTTGAKIPS